MDKRLVDVLTCIWPGNPVWHGEREASVKDIPLVAQVEIYGNATKMLMIERDGERTPIEDVLPSEEPCFENKYTQLLYGFNASGHKYVMVFDNDDVMYHGMIEQLIAKAEAEDAAIVYCNYELMDADGKHLQYVDLNPRYDFELNCQQACYPDVALFRRDVIRECGGFDISKGRYVMWWLWLQIGAKYPNRIFHVPYYGFRYRQHSGGLHHQEVPADRERFEQEVQEWAQNTKVLA